MKRLPRWTSLTVALLALISIHGWHIKFLMSGQEPLQGSVSIQAALLTSARNIPNTFMLFTPAWLPVLVPQKMARLSRWVAVVCCAISLAIAVSLGIFVALRQEWFFAVVSAVYAVIGFLQLASLPAQNSMASVVQNNGI